MEALFENTGFVYLCIIRVFCTGTLISSLEYLFAIDQYSNEGFFSWKVFRLTSRDLNAHLFARFPGLTFGRSAIAILMVLRLLSCVALLINPINGWSVYLIAAIALSSLLVSYRNIVGADGSDQMNAILFVTLLITFIAKDTNIAGLGLYFIGAQAILSYVVAGMAKFISPKWRSGMAVFEIMNTKTYGDKKIARFLKRSSPALTYLLNWYIIIFECMFFCVLLIRYPYFLIFLVLGFLFHLYNAVSMGLNGFFWAFLASYPAIVYTSLHLHKFLF